MKTSIRFSFLLILSTFFIFPSRIFPDTLSSQAPDHKTTSSVTPPYLQFPEEIPKDPFKEKPKKTQLKKTLLILSGVVTVSTGLLLANHHHGKRSPE